MKKWLLGLSAIIIMCILADCAGLGDWSNEPLPGGYEVWRSSVHEIALVKPDESGNCGSVVIPKEIYAVCYNDEYICAQWEACEPDPKDFYKEPHGEISYYILSVASGEAQGPYNYEDYAAACSKLNISGLCDWVNAKALPRQPHFPVQAG